MDQWLLYEHEDGRHAAAPSANAATFATGDPRWHRVGPLAVALPAGDAGAGLALKPIGASTAVAGHLEKILQSEELGNEFARCSPTEAVMG